MQVHWQLIPVRNAGWHWTVARFLLFDFAPDADQLLLQVAHFLTIPLTHDPT
jgi:hypothetical protein